MAASTAAQPLPTATACADPRSKLRRIARAARPVRARQVLASLLVLGTLGLVTGCAGLPVSAIDARDAAVPQAEQIIVAVREVAEPLPTVGGTPRTLYGRIGYAGGAQAASVAEAVARDHALQAQAAWTIVPLGLRCMVYRLPVGADRDTVLQRLAQDPRVALAQPLNAFETLGAPTPAPPVTAASPDAGDESAASAAPGLYNDPYFGLQRGFTALDAAAAQRWSQGQGVRVALIDTGVDVRHPDLAGRVAAVQDLVPAHPPPPAGERHGTGMAGVIAAVANNRLGIVGIAPDAQLLVLRACWQLAAPADGARCDSFSLARALDAAIVAKADVINLSLGGPADPLLQRLLEVALQRGAIVVGATLPGGRPQGFPAGVTGVLAVASSDDAPLSAGMLAAPGRDILTLQPGGGYDFATGSSLSAAQVSGAAALLRALQPDLPAQTVQAWLGGARVDACNAVRHLRSAARCAAGPHESR